MVDAGDSKSPAERLVGSSPTSGTTNNSLKSLRNFARSFFLLLSEKNNSHFDSHIHDLFLFCSASICAALDITLRSAFLR